MFAGLVPVDGDERLMCKLTGLFCDAGGDCRTCRIPIVVVLSDLRDVAAGKYDQ